MRLLWWTPAPHTVPSAYGKVTRNLCLQLEKLGHEVWVYSSLNFHYDHVVIDGLKILCNPFQHDRGGALQAQRLVAGGKFDHVIYFGDGWPLALDLVKFAQNTPLTVYLPIDHEPLSSLLAPIYKAAARSLVPSFFGQKVLEQAGFKTTTIYHGYDPAVYYQGGMKAKRAARKRLNWPQEDFIFLTVATNKGTRKNWIGMINAYGEAHRASKAFRHNARWAWSTYPFMNGTINPDGYSLGEYAKLEGIEGRLLMLDDPFQLAIGVPETVMADMYRGADMLLAASAAEGFGMPILEADVCGTPAIVTNFSSMPELAANNGLLVDVVARDIPQLLPGAYHAVPDPVQLTEAILEGFATAGEGISRTPPKGDLLKVYTWEKCARDLARALGQESATLWTPAV